MDIHIFIDFDENDNALLTVNLPIELMDINEEVYCEICHQPFYVEKGLKLNAKNIQNELNKLLQIIKNNFTNTKLFDNTFNISYNIDDEYINKENIIESLKQNKNFKITLNAKEYKYLINNLNENELPNLNVRFKNNYEPISFKKFYNMYKFLDEIISFVKHYNLSPLEQVMLVYDIVKAHEYTRENEGESLGTSRSLSEIISSGKIVCDGFANLFNFILDELGIQNKKVYLSYTNKEFGHARNMVYLKDEKYNLNNFFITDATFDCKNQKRNKNYINNYYFFLKPLYCFNNNEEIVENPKVLNILRMTDEKIEEHLKTLKLRDKTLILLQLNYFLNENENNPSLFFAKENIIDKKIKENIKTIKKLLNKRIPEVAFKNALYKVRKIEFINNIIKKEVTEEEINNICNLFYQETPEIKLLKALNLYENPNLEKDLEEANAKSAEEDLLRMRLLRAMKIKLQDLPKNEFIKKM
ncbi:MAG: hypothetical protein IJE04_03970 [Bacilli bacterium]|nr:hypothetical protein [Bacilli bacterium]